MAPSTDAPKMAFDNELMESTFKGSALMASMVEDSVVNDILPPHEIWEWYVTFTAYRFVMTEYNAVYRPNENSEAALHMIRESLGLVQDVLIRQKQFGLQQKVNDILRTRKLHLPEAYVRTLKE